MIEPTRTVVVHGRVFRLGCLTECQLERLFVMPGSQLTVWEQYSYAILAAMESGGMRSHDSNREYLDGLTVADTHALLEVISELHGGMSTFQLASSGMRLLYSEINQRIH